MGPLTPVNYDALVPQLMHTQTDAFDAFYAECSQVPRALWFSSPDVPCDLHSCAKIHVSTQKAGIFPVAYRNLEHYIAIDQRNPALVRVFDPCLPRKKPTRYWSTYARLLETKVAAAFPGRPVEWDFPPEAIQPDPLSAVDPMCSFYSAHWLRCRGVNDVVKFRYQALERAKRVAIDCCLLN